MKTKDIAPLRNSMLEDQGHICPLCSKSLQASQAALDHDHETGHVRAVLHRNCNSVEGRIKHWAKRSGVDHRTFVRTLVEYWDGDYSGNPIHPKHKSPIEKEIAALRKRQKKLKTVNAQMRYERKIEALQRLQK